ncbi:RNA 2'-phosphotransferase [Bradyrhizobium sp. HKCCYLS3077]|uniref:RNA 2'-phosphotransferase n=1 Tax=Bradyrhizobium sp. HKCCYLS3077 TaxID=3420761 RepID=UPI003EB7330B
MAFDPVRLSKFLSLVLRHQPEAIGLALDVQGWTAIDDLIARATAAGTAFTRAELEHVVATSDKKRFTISDDGLRIRAAQGHSVSVELGLAPSEPPAVLFHGTATRFVESIMAQGLKPQSRQHVHLSLDEANALNVGRRHGKPVIFRVDAAAMHRAGMAFYVADNGVWLTDHVPSTYLTPCATS